MVEAGWVQRLDDAADLRVRRLGLSARGRQLFDRAWPAVEQLNRLAVEGLSAADVATLRTLLRRMKQNLERAHDAPAVALSA
jgi:DNA-binding MarR family transcriptional regulator